MPLGAEKAIYRFLSDDGLTTGNKDMSVDGTTPATFYVGPPAGRTWHIARIMFNIEDAVASIGPQLFGGIDQLTNGVDIQVQRDGATLLDLIDGIKIKHNAEFGNLAYDVSYQSSGNASKNSNVQSRFTFSKAGQDLVLSGSRLDRIAVVINDDLTNLVHFRAMIQGYEVS